MDKQLDGLYSIKVLPGGRDALFEERETGLAHTPYETETIFYSYLRAGDVEGVAGFINTFMKNGLVVGRLSGDDMRQMRYWAVCCVTLATRYAIQGGLDETDAFNLSDGYIRTIDRLESPEKIVIFLSEKARELAERVRAAKVKPGCHRAVRKCINFINRNLHGRLTLADMAAHCGLSGDYLAALFKKETGKTPAAYVLERKLESAKAMLNGGYGIDEVGYYLGFSSESHFISRFKSFYGITPKAYLNGIS